MFLPWEMDELERLLRRIVQAGIEGVKIDFKTTLDVSSKSGRSEFSKDVSAISNTDSDDHNGYGFIVLGATRGNLLGGVDKLLQGRTPDNFQAAIIDILREYLTPVPRVCFIQYQDQTVGTWGVIVIEPSNDQPHHFVREFSGDPTRGDWFVRINDTTHKARLEDWYRILSKSVRRALAPAQTQIEELQRRIIQLETKQFDTMKLAEMLLQSPARTDEATTNLTDTDPLASLRRELRQRSDEISDTFKSQTAHIRTQLRNNPELPWLLPRDTQAARKMLDFYIELARPLLIAGAMLVYYQKGEQYFDFFLAALSRISVVPSAVGKGPCHPDAARLRLLPSAVCLLGVACVAVARQNPKAIRKLFSQQCILDETQDRSFDIIMSLKVMKGMSDTFRSLLAQQQPAPFDTLIKERVLPLLIDSFDEDAEATLFQTEFVISLLFAEAADDGTNDPYILPGLFLYSYNSDRAIQQLFITKRRFLDELFGTKLIRLLSIFDSTASRMVDHRYSVMGGVLNGTVELFNRINRAQEVVKKH